MFKAKPPVRGAYAPEGKTIIFSTPYDLPDLRGRQAYIKYFADRAKDPLREKCLA